MTAHSSSPAPRVWTNEKHIFDAFTEDALGAPPLLKFCTSCRHNLDAYLAFKLGRKTCRSCLEKHRVHQAQKREAVKSLKVKRDFTANGEDG